MNPFENLRVLKDFAFSLTTGSLVIYRKTKRLVDVIIDEYHDSVFVSRRGFWSFVRPILQIVHLLTIHLGSSVEKRHPCMLSWKYKKSPFHWTLATMLQPKWPGNCNVMTLFFVLVLFGPPFDLHSLLITFCTNLHAHILPFSLLLRV